MIRLAFDNPFPPLAVSDGKRARGAVIDILSAALSLVGVRPKFIPVPMEEIKSMLESRKVDGIAFYAVTAERKTVFDFSDTLLVTGAGLFVRSPGPPAPGLSGYENESLVTPKTGPLAEYIRKEAPKAKLLLVRDYVEALRSVREGRATAAALNIHAGRDLARRLFPGCFTPPEKAFLETPLAVAVLKGKGSSLLGTIDEGLSRLKASAAYAGIIEKWDL